MNDPRTGWFAEVDASTTVTEVATRLGLIVRRKRFGPCPVCNADDKRGPVGIPRPVVWCCKCGAKGSMAQLVRAVFPAMTWADVRGWFADAGWCSPGGEARSAWVAPPPRPPPPPMPYADETELARFLTLGGPVEDDPEVAAFWHARGFGARTGAAWALPTYADWPTWWGHGRAKVWRLACPMYDAQGVVRSVHARAVVDAGVYASGKMQGEPRGKTRPASGVRGDSLLFADPWIALPMLRGERVACDSLAIEGITDFCASTSQAYPGLAILGVISGSCAAFADIRFAPGSVLFVGTDNDEQGDKYAAAIFAAAKDRVECRRVVWGTNPDGTVADASDLVKRHGDVRARLAVATGMG